MKHVVLDKYACSICGASYDTVQERAKCELKCVKKIEEEERKAAEAKKQAEKDARHTEVFEALKTASDLLSAYTEDYGHFEYEGGSDYIWPSRLFHYFW